MLGDATAMMKQLMQAMQEAKPCNRPVVCVDGRSHGGVERDGPVREWRTRSWEQEHESNGGRPGSAQSPRPTPPSSGWPVILLRVKCCRMKERRAAPVGESTLILSSTAGRFGGLGGAARARSD